jgi:hypothetical protein
MSVLLGAIKDYSYYEKRTPSAGKIAILKNRYGNRFSGKKVTIIKAYPKLGNYWLVKYGKETFAIPANDIERIIVKRK